MPPRLVSEETMEEPAAAPPASPKMPNLAPMINAIRVGLLALNARALLFLGLLGAFWLGFDAVQEPTLLRIGADTLYTVGVLWPLVWLTALRG